MSNETYSIKPIGHTVSFSDMLKTARDLEWLNYEVDPSWARFCSFGPDDIGSVWEQIGAIRKRPRFDAIMVGEKMLKALNEQLERQVLNGCSGFNYSSVRADAVLFGVRVVGSPLLSDKAVLVNSRGV